MSTCNALNNSYKYLRTCIILKEAKNVYKLSFDYNERFVIEIFDDNVNFLINKKEIHHLRHVLFRVNKFKKTDFCKDQFRWDSRKVDFYGILLWFINLTLIIGNPIIRRVLTLYKLLHSRLFPALSLLYNCSWCTLPHLFRDHYNIDHWN